MSDLRFALELADAADDISARYFRSQDLKVSAKPDSTYVTEADKAVEKELRALIAHDHPDHAVLGEEEGLVGSAESGYRWIIDPIDGTHNYMRGIPVYATLIALEHDGEMVVGVASAPSMGHRWWAARGEGAFLDGSPIGVSQVARIEDAQITSESFSVWETFSDKGEQFKALVRRCWRSRGFGDFWQHMLVAEGAADIAVEPVVSVWDLAAVQVIVEEAGGRFTDLKGARRADGGTAVSTNGLLHADVLAALS